MIYFNVILLYFDQTTGAEKKKKIMKLSLLFHRLYFGPFSQIHQSRFFYHFSLLPESFIKCKKIFSTLPFHVIAIATRIRSGSKTLVQYIEINIALEDIPFKIILIVYECESCSKFERMDREHLIRSE